MLSSSVSTDSHSKVAVYSEYFIILCFTVTDFVCALNALKERANFYIVLAIMAII